MNELWIRRNDLAACELVEVPRDQPSDGEAQLLVERFALSVNNVTYAKLGDELGYWRVFPAPDGWGRIPAWGYSRVLASRSPALAEGSRWFGLVPMGRSLTVRPAAHPAGFADAAEHRAELARVYNMYLPVEAEADDAALVMRPLFGTSVLLDLLLAEISTRKVVITSASSKTAYGLAHLLQQRDVETVGLTAAARRGWVEGLGLYAAVLSYDAIDDLRISPGTVLVDFAGDPAVVRAVHERGPLERSIAVGFTHGGRTADTADFFFAPDEMVRRGRELAARYAEAWRGFAPVAARTMRIERIDAGAELVRVYRDLLAGRADPAVGYVVTP